MIDNRLHAQARVKGVFGTPAHPAVAFFATSDINFEIAYRKGGIQGIIRYELDITNSSEHIRNAGTGNRKETRNRAVSLNYTLNPQNEYNSVQSWQTVATSDEQAQLDAQKDRYQALVTALEQEAATHTLAAEKAELLDSYREIVEQCSLNSTRAISRVGFLESIPSVFGLGGNCLYDSNGTPNVRKIRRSTFKLGKDRPFHLSLRFSKPLPGQRDTSFKVRWGPFVLEFRKGERVTLSMYSRRFYTTGTSAEWQRIAAAEADIEQYRDEHRLTDEDLDYIEGQKEVIRQAHKSIRDQHLKRTDPAYITIHAQIKQAETNITARHQLKRAAPGQTMADQRFTEADLYDFHDQHINIQESTENFYDTPLLLTFLPQRRGFLTMTLRNHEPVTIRLPEILASKRAGTIWNDTFITLESNGGAFEWQFLHPNADAWGEYRLKDVPVPFELTASAIGPFDGHYDISGDGRTPNRSGLSIDFQIVPLGRQGGNYFYDFVITLRSEFEYQDAGGVTRKEGRYFPWLYTLRLFVDAGERTPDNNIIWTSEYYGLPNPGADNQIVTLNPANPNPNTDSPIEALSMSFDDIDSGVRGSRATVKMRDIYGTANIPTSAGHLVDLDVGVWNAMDGVRGMSPYFRNGVIIAEGLPGLATLNSETGHPDPTASTKRTWTIRDLWYLVENYEIRTEVEGDGHTLGDHFWHVLRLMGFTDAELAGIPRTGLLAGPVLPTSGVGDNPAYTTMKGVKAGQYLRRLLNEFGMSDDYRELRLFIKDGVFTMDVPSLANVFNFSSEAGTVGPGLIRAAPSIMTDWSGFFNIFEVRGRADRRTGEQIKCVWKNYNVLNNPATPAISYEKPYPVFDDPNLDTESWCARVAWCLAIRHSKSGVFREWRGKWQYPPIYPGDVGLVDGVQQEIVRIPEMGYADGTTAEFVTRSLVDFTRSAG